MMVVKNQVHHDLNDTLSKADDAIVGFDFFYLDFFDVIYMAMEFMPGGDHHESLDQEDTFSEGM
jgi:hypothetical protein